MRNWFRSLGKSALAKNRRGRFRDIAPRLELLEDRCLMSFNVGSHVAGPNINVSNLAGYQGETTIAINPTNPLNMIGGSNNLGSGGVTMSYWTMDGGATWHTSGLGGQNGDPVVAFDRVGNAYMTYIDGSLGIGVAKSTNGGQTWGANTTVGPNHGSGIQDKPWIAIGPDAVNNAIDRIYVAWDDNSSGDVVKVVSSNNAGSSWTAPKTISGTVNEFFTAPAVGPLGQFYLAYTNFGTSGQSSIKFTVSLDNGTTFSTPTVAAVSLINTFNPGRYNIPAQPNRGINPTPMLAVERSGANAGRIFLSYATAVSAQHNNTEINLVASDNGGASWTALGATPVRVNDDTGAGSQFFPAMSIDPSNGNVVMAWYDTRNSANLRKTDIYFQDFTSAGSRDGVNVKVTTAMSTEASFTKNPNQYGDYMGIAAMNGIAYPIWCDHRTPGRNTEEVFVDPPIPGGQHAAPTQPVISDIVQTSIMVTAIPTINAAPAPIAFGTTPLRSRTEGNVPVVAMAVAAAPGSAGAVVIAPVRQVSHSPAAERYDEFAPLLQKDEAALPPALADDIAGVIASVRFGIVDDQPAMVNEDQVRDECFAGDRFSNGSPCQDQTGGIMIEGTVPAMDLAIAAAGAAFVLNGFGGSRDKESKPKVSRRLRI